MGSKRSSSKKPTRARSSPPQVDPPADVNHQSLGTPSKSRKKLKLSAPISADSGLLSLTPTTDGEGKALEASNEISPSAGDGAASRSRFLRWGEAHNLKLLKSVTALGVKGGSVLKSENIAVILKETNDWAPNQLSEKNLYSKLRHLRFKFLKSPKPGPESSDFDRGFYELASRVWGPESLKAKYNAIGGAKEHDRVENKVNTSGKREKTSKKPKGEKNKLSDEKEDEDVVGEERDSENDEDTDEKAEKNMILETGEEHEKDKLLVDGDNDLLDAKEAGHSYKYLRLALEEYWTESKLNMDTLYAALPKVNPIQAKQLDENFREVFVGMLKLKMEKNKVSNEIICASLGC